MNTFQNVFNTLMMELTRWESWLKVNWRNTEVFILTERKDV